MRLVKPSSAPNIFVLASIVATLFCSAVRADRPNIIVLFTDDQQFRAIGYNNPEVKTPNLDRLAAGGMIFDRAYIATPICMASRASMMTGLFPQQHGAIALDTAGFRKNIVDEKRFPTLPLLLQDSGYDTAFCGKSHLGPPKDYGFGFGTENAEWNDDTTFAVAQDFLANRPADASPFFLWVATHQPHVPLLPTAEWIAPYEGVTFTLDPNFMTAPPAGSIYNQGLPGESYFRDSEYTRNYKDGSAGPPRSAEAMQEFLRGYYATITRLDDQIGTLIETLRAANLEKNTIVIFLSDNGYMLGNHGLGNKITMHEESVRVPMFIYGAPVKQPGTRSDALVSSLDVMPTVLEIAGITVPDNLAGKSLLPLLKDPGQSVRKYVASECVGVGGDLGTGHRMVRDERWKYVLTGTNEEYLFDEEKDPYELENLAADKKYGGVLGALRAQMVDWMDGVKDEHMRPPIFGALSLE